MKHILGNTYQTDFIKISQTDDGIFHANQNGVSDIWTPDDRKVEFIEIGEQVLCNVKSSMGYPAIYPMRQADCNLPAKAVLMDLDGTSVHSESFWIWIIEQTVCVLLNNPQFCLSEEDFPFVSGHSVSEHLKYCIDKYAPRSTVEQARAHYFNITRFEMSEIMAGRGKENAFTPAPHLKEFLLELKAHHVKIGLVTSGLTEKAMPEIVSAFRTLGMGNPLDFYDAVISAGTNLTQGQVGTLGELEPKPHPWLYAETARVGLGFSKEENCVIAMEDSAAGVVSARLAGFPCIGIEGGNIRQSGVTSLCCNMYSDLMDTLPAILG